MHALTAVHDTDHTPGPDCESLAIASGSTIDGPWSSLVTVQLNTALADGPLASMAVTVEVQGARRVLLPAVGREGTIDAGPDHTTRILAYPVWCVCCGYLRLHNLGILLS